MNKPPDWAIRTKADELALERGCYWDDKQAKRITTFANKIFKPQFISGEFQLLEWQTRFLQSLYGWRAKDGTRRWKYAVLHIPKKQGKTLCCAIVSAFELCAAGEQSPFVVSGSVSKENAAQIFDEIHHSLNKTGLAKHCRITPHQKRIKIPSLNAEYRSLASDGSRVHGLNCSCIILDEGAYHKNSNLFDALANAHIARPNGLRVSISTSGFDVTGWYHEQYSKAKRILAGEDLDTLTYAEVYEADEDGDPEDVAQWRKALPSIGTSFSEDVFAQEMESAKASSTDWLRFLRQRLNFWTRADDLAFFDVNVWDKHKLDEPELDGLPCYLGVDLSLTIDPSSVSAIFVMPDGSYYAKSFAWVASEGVKLRERTSLARYQDFATNPNFVITDGDMIDHEAILSFLIAQTQRYDVRGIAFDPTSAFVMMNRIEDETGCHVERVPPSFRYLSAPMEALRKAIHDGQIKHDGNNWLRYCLSCVRVAENEDGEVRPSVKKSTDHIDGAYALLLAYRQIFAKDTTVNTGLMWA